MTYFQSLEEIREWVLLHEPNIDTAYATMVAIKALWNDGYNQAMVDAAVPPGETPRPSGFIGEDAGDLSVATEQLQEAPPDIPDLHGLPDSPDMTHEAYMREGEAAFPDQTPDEEAPSEVPPPTPSGDWRRRMYDTVMLDMPGRQLTTRERATVGWNRNTKTIDLPEGYKAILTLDPSTNHYKCGPIEFTDDVVFQGVSHSDALRIDILHDLKRAMPLLVVAGCHREFVHWCDQHGYQWMSLYGKVFPYAKYVGRPEEIAGYDNREQRIRLIGNYRESDAFRGAAMFNLHDHIIGSSDPELRSHAEGDGHPDAAERYSGLPIAPITAEEVREAVDYVRRYSLSGDEFRQALSGGLIIPTQSPEAEASQREAERGAALRRVRSYIAAHPEAHGWATVLAQRIEMAANPDNLDSGLARYGRIYRRGMDLADYIRALREAGEITDELAEQMIVDYIRSVGEGGSEPDLEPPEEEPDENGYYERT